MIYGGSKKGYKSKVLISIFVILIVILIGVLCERSIAAYLGSSGTGLSNVKSKGGAAVGDTVTAGYNDLVARRDLYCVMYQKSLSVTNYVVGRYVIINGNTATNDVGQSYTSIENGKLAYILSRGEGYGAQHAYTTTQRALYKAINNWYDGVGSRLGINNKWPANNIVSGGDSLISEATNYATSLGNNSESNSSATDKTKKNKITVTAYTNDSTEYLRIGPFNWAYSGELTGVKVYGDSGKQISGIKYSKFEGSTEKFYNNISDIGSGKDFYISIKANSGFTKIAKITATVQNTSSNRVYNAQIWFLNSSSSQNVILVDTGSANPNPTSLDTTFNYDIPLLKDIEIIKVDSVKKDLKLDNVAFIIQNKDTGKYLQKSGSTYNFVNKGSATEFITQNGRVFIKDVPVATYVAYETKNPNKGYEILEKGITISISENKKQISNDYQLGNIKIEKIDSLYPEKKLESVEFTLRATSGKYKGKYVGVNDKGKAYYSDSVIYIKTDKKGSIRINEIWKGDYKLTETNNPNYGYKISDENLNIDVKVKPYKTSEMLISNQYELGEIRIEKVDSVYPDKKLKDVEFTLQATSGEYQGKYVGIDSNGDAYYSDSVIYLTTNERGIIAINKVWKGKYKLTETKNPNYGYMIDEKNLNIELEVKPYKTSEKVVTNRYELGDISIEKVDSKHPEIKLKNVLFTLKAETGRFKGQYVGINENGDAVYADGQLYLSTDENGKLDIHKVWEGKYTLTEIENANYGYIIDEQSKVVEVEVKPYNAFEKQIKNEQVYIRLSGFIWQDIENQNGKSIVRNDYYKTNTPQSYEDGKDQAFNGIQVKLKRIDTGEIVKEGYSDRKEFTNKDQVDVSEEKDIYDEIDGGEYVFEYVRVDELSNYYVEFEYDGLIYQNVIAHLDHNNGSKASDEKEREILDRNFAYINSTGANEVNVNNGSRDVYNIKYNETIEHEATIKDSSACIIHAKTHDAQCNINNYFVPGQTEIKYINLGLYKRSQADITLGHDLQNVNVGVNGYWHVYNYDTMRISEANSESWNVGVKFKSLYSGRYKRAIYKSDLDYQTDDKSKELQVYLTYKIAFRNDSAYITRVNNIIDYFDNRYSLVVAGTELDSNSNVINNINVQNVQGYNDKYQKCIIDVNSIIKPGETNSIYVQFKLDRTAVMEIVNNRETLNNCAEVNSYTVLKDESGNTLAAVDKDSVPGNAIMDNFDTFEDDTSTAPPVLLEINANARRIEGTVFVDSTSNELKTGEIRQGDGIFNDGEKTIEGVKVTLHELNNSIPDMTTTTDANGNFKFEAYIPGQYIVTYTWGDKTYMVQYYKGTVYDVGRKQNDMYWYRGSEYNNDTISVNDRKTDAIDDYNRRIAIDNEISAITDNSIYEQINKAYNGETSKITITTMDSTTPTMEFSVEYDTVVTDGTIDKVEFVVKNVDFGIVERARQQMDINKRVSSFKITLANGQVLADATIDENGKLNGSHDYVTYMAPNNNNGNAFKGYVRAEIDNELLEGAALEVGYEIKAVNNSELDFMTEVYYKYGTTGGNIVTLTPSAVVDYLDKNLAFDTTKNPDWREISVDDLRDLNVKRLNEPDAEQFLNSRLLLFTDKTQVALKPRENVSVGLNVSKLLTTSKDLTFDNDADVVHIDRVRNGNNSSTIPGVNPTPTHTGSVVQYFPEDSAEEIQITPSTGDNRAFVVPVVVGVSALIVLSFGVIVVKRRIVDR